MSCLECAPHEPTDRCCFALHWGRIGRGSGIASAAGFAWPSRLGFWRFQRLLRTVVILGEGPTFLTDMGNRAPAEQRWGGGTGRSAMGSAGPGGSFEGLAQGDRDASTWGPGSGARRTTYSPYWVPAMAGRGRWGTASSQRQIASIDRSRHTSFHSGGTSGQLRVHNISCVSGFRHTSSLALLGVPQGVRDRNSNRAPGSLGPRPGPWRGPSPATRRSCRRFARGRRLLWCWCSHF